MEKIVDQGLMAFLPVYVHLKGNCTSVYTSQGENFYLEKSLRTFLNQLAQHYFLDLRAVRKYYGQLLAIRNLVPLPLNAEDIFIPLKIRKPICKNDGSIGYINIKHIEKTRESKGRVLIQLNNQISIESLNSLATVKKHIANGHLVKELYREKNTSQEAKEETFYTEYNRPATKGDIAFLIREIAKITGGIRN